MTSVPLSTRPARLYGTTPGPGQETRLSQVGSGHIHTVQAGQGETPGIGAGISQDGEHAHTGACRGTPNIGTRCSAVSAD